MITTQNPCLPSKWEDILKNKDINIIFSNDGINNYTSSVKKDNNDYYINFDNNNNDDNNNHNKDEDEKSNVNVHRVITSTPFNSRSVISYGLMVFAKDTKRWVIVRDKHNSEYILLIKGYYRSTFTKLLLSKLTSEELETIKTILTSTIDVFVNIYLNILNLEKNGLLYAIVRMAESRKDILEMIDDIDVSKNTLPWAWPKGRIQNYYFKETDFQCAIREFTEEVEINLPPPLLTSDNYLEENIIAITGRKLEARFWIYVIPNEIELQKPHDHPEVSDRMWVDTETCFKLIPKSTNHVNIFNKVINSTL